MKPPRLDGVVVRIGAVVMLGTLMPMLDVTVVNVALPSIQESFGAGPGESVAHAYASWTVTAYALALAAAIPIAGWAGDRFGTRRLYLTALIIFLLGSTLCATTGSMPALIATRVLQGIGGGILLPTGMSILARAAGPDRMGRLVALLGVPVLIGPIAGPLLGGWLVGTVGWRWIFLINLPLGVAACCAAVRTLPASRPTGRTPLDRRGLLLMSPGLALLLLGVLSLADTGTVTSPIPALATTSGAMLVLGFLVHAFRAPAPLVDPRLLLHRGLRVPVLVLCLFQASFFGALVLIPTFFQQARGEPVQTAALLLLPQGIGALLSMPLAGALSDRYPAGHITPLGLALVSAGLTGLAAIGSTASYEVLVAMLFVMGLGMGATVAPTMIAALRTLGAADLPQGSSILTIVQQVASAAGLAVLSTYLTRLLSDGADHDVAFSHVFAASAGLVAMTTLIAARALPHRESSHRSATPSSQVHAEPPPHRKSGAALPSAQTRVLLLTADTGGGHRASTDALREEFAHRYGDQISTALLDPMTGHDAPPVVARLTRLYGPLIRRAPWVWGLLFYSTDVTPICRMMTALMTSALRRRLTEAVRRHDPDVIAVLHPLLVAPATAARRDHPAPVVTVVTDLGRPHNAWWHRDADHIVVPHRSQSRAKADMWSRNDAREHPFGLVVRRQFTDAASVPDRDQIRRRLGLGRGRFVVMVSGGGEGARGTERWARALVNGPADVDVVVACGRNQRLHGRLARLNPPEGRGFIVLGFVDDIATYMSAADLMVTKAGPGVIAEAAALGLPLVIAGHLPGQESGNREHVVGAGAGLGVDSTRDLVATVNDLHHDRDHLDRLREGARRTGRPHAGAMTTDLITTLSKETR